MKKQTEINVPAQYIKRVNINGMHGRMLILPQRSVKSRKQRDILLLYGHHASLERMYSLAVNLSEYATITMPDLPGFGGMDSFYTIGKKPTIDNMADYMATFVKLRYKGRPFSVCAISYGFVVATRMLQKYPDIAKQVKLVVSLVGFSHYSDFSMGIKQPLLIGVSKIGSFAPVSVLAKYTIFSRPIVSLTYAIMAKSHAKMKDADRRELQRRIRFEVYLWSCNDARTRFATAQEFLRVDLTGTKISKTVYHTTADNDQYLDQTRVVDHFKIIFRRVYAYKAIMPNHMPTVVSDPEEAGVLIPAELRKIIKRSV